MFYVPAAAKMECPGFYGHCFQPIFALASSFANAAAREQQSRVYDESGNVLETHDWRFQRVVSALHFGFRAKQNSRHAVKRDADPQSVFKAVLLPSHTRRTSGAPPGCAGR